MPLTFDATPGGANATSFASVDDFKSYRDTRLPTVSWAVNADDPTIQNALMAACRLFNASFDWTGVAATATQALAWPRIGMLTRNGYALDPTMVPQELKDAQCELALQIGADDRMSDNDPERLGITAVKAGSVGVNFRTINEGNYESADVQVRKNQSDMRYLKRVIPDAVRQILVPSWFVQDNIRKPILFQAQGSTTCGLW